VESLVVGEKKGGGRWTRKSDGVRRGVGEKDEERTISKIQGG